MKKIPLYTQYETTKPVAFLAMCSFGGIEILDIIYDIDEYAIACFNFGTGRQQIRKHKIQVSSSGRNYIRKQNVRYYLDQFIRTNTTN